MSKRLTYEYVKGYIEKEEYNLISKLYKNCMTKLKFICPEGHSFDMTFNNFQQGRRCPICANKYNGNLQRLSINHIKNEIKSIAAGYKLLSTEYKNTNTKLKFMCPKNHKFWMTFSNFKAGHRCAKCAGNKKLTIEYIREQVPLINEGYKLLSLKYKGSGKKYTFQCNNNHIYKASWDNFKQGKKCPECRKLSVDYVKKQLQLIAPEFELLSTKYKTVRKKHKFRCGKGHIFNVRLDSFLQNCVCPECSRLSRCGSGHPSWKNYTKEDLTKITNYRANIIQLSEKYYKKYYYQVNPKEFKRGFRNYHLDHIYSIMRGFKNNVPPEIITNPNNLQMLWWVDNLSKKDRADQTKQELYLGYYKFKLGEDND